MKAGILTFHMAHNYGAMLQAYALCKKIRDFNIECEVIDYRLPEIYKYHKKYTVKETLVKDGIFIGILKTIKRYISGYYWKDKRWLKFYNFMKNDMGISEKCFTEKSQLNAIKYDAYVCGSDQIWNKDLTGELKEEYFCDFASKDPLKIAYAASKGPCSISEDERIQFLKLLNNFDYISVREEGLAESLNNLGIKNVENVLDPSLLLEEEDWLKAANDKYNKWDNYVLIYKIKDDLKLYEVARKIAREKGCKILEITYEKKDDLKDVIQLEDCGPKEFIQMFYNAKYVVTNSFHGTCFSIIFKKIFYAVPYTNLSSRIDSLLNLLELNERNIEDINSITEMKPINYDNAYKILERERQNSIQFLRRSLEIK